MSKKWMAITGVVVVVVVVIAAALLLTSHKASSPSGAASSSTSAPSSSSSVGSSSASTGTPSATSTTSPGSTTAGGVVSPGGTTEKVGTGGTQPGSAPGALTPYPKLPDPGIAAMAVSAPFPDGQKLPPLLSAPTTTQYALKTNTVFSRAEYSIVFQPYGIGPDSVWGSGLVVLIKSSKPIGGATKYNKIVGQTWLLIPATTAGGTVTKGGTYKGTLTWRSDGKELLPILSSATLVK